MALDLFLNTFAGNPLDRASDRRGDADWLKRQIDSDEALAVALWNGKPLVEDGGASGVQISYLPGRLAGELAGGSERLLFLGLWKETAIFAVDLEGQTDPADGGWKRSCEACEAEHFPRTDPVVIMLPYHGDRCMLGRQDAWPKGMFSALAGFLEPGEAIEEACSRELNEEAGLHAVKVRYHSSQPWPYPSSLMIGLLAEVEDEEGSPDQTELSEVRWFTRAEARDLLAGKLPGAFAPPPLAIAHQLIKSWAAEAS